MLCFSVCAHVLCAVHSLCPPTAQVVRRVCVRMCGVCARGRVSGPAYSCPVFLSASGLLAAVHSKGPVARGRALTKQVNTTCMGSAVVCSACHAGDQRLHPSLICSTKPGAHPGALGPGSCDTCILEKVDLSPNV